MSKILERDKRQVMVRLTSETKRELRMIAAKNDTSVSKIIAKLIEENLFKNKA